MTPHEPNCRCHFCVAARCAYYPRIPRPRTATGPDGYSAPEPDDEATRDAAFLKRLGIKP